MDFLFSTDLRLYLGDFKAAYLRGGLGEFFYSRTSNRPPNVDRKGSFLFSYFYFTLAA